MNKRDRETIIPIAKAFDRLGFTITATRGTARDLYDAGILCEIILKVHEGHPNIIDNIRNRKVDLVINTPMGFMAKKSDDDIRTEAMRMKIPYTTTTSAAEAAIEAITHLNTTTPLVKRLPEYKR